MTCIIHEIWNGYLHNTYEIFQAWKKPGQESYTHASIIPALNYKSSVDEKREDFEFKV
jgi:hypothetical protein